MKHGKFDVIVIGGGHAGVEAAAAAARMGTSVAIITLKKDDLGVMSCNPAIGGLGKGHLVREIDALDGVMGQAADRAGIQFRLLNRKKGPAVQGPRAQADRQLYKRAVSEIIGCYENITILPGEVVDLKIAGDQINGIVLSDGSHVDGRTVILTSGTFLNGKIFVGTKTQTGGRMGSDSASRLAHRLADFGFPVGRLKTGTPPRLRSKTIDWTKLEMQPGDTEPVLFSFLSQGVKAKQICCGITHTNEKTHDIIRKNLSQSAMYGGLIEGVGPRYCPSIEDKITRFADKSSHQIFLEPEGLTSDLVYPNGISTSLPAETQEEYVRSILGLENAEITQPGYAIEYDFFDPRHLTACLAVRDIDGLFFAGQINGTTGYEEAAAQGLIAGLNAAARVLGLEEIQFSRTNSYLGVLVDDLTTKGVSEPYRMFTSRAEFRLHLRADNADQRLTQIGIDLGCISSVRQDRFFEKTSQLKSAKSQLADCVLDRKQLAKCGFPVGKSTKNMTVIIALAHKDVEWPKVCSVLGDKLHIHHEIARQIKIDATYAVYMDRQTRTAEALRAEENRRIPHTIDYKQLSGLSSELASKLDMIRPENIAQASRIDGMTPSALTLILAFINRERQQKAS